jgi:hypothetical protein
LVPVCNHSLHGTKFLTLAFRILDNSFRLPLRPPSLALRPAAHTALGRHTEKVGVDPRLGSSFLVFVCLAPGQLKFRQLVHDLSPFDGG